MDDWPSLRVTANNLAEYFDGQAQNIGFLCGEPSGGIVDIDLDCPEAIKLAPTFLPPTCSFGRAGAPSSHWLYLAPGAKTAKFKDPVTGTMLVELRSDGCQTVGPGSVHPSGEEIRWDQGADGKPKAIDKGDLLRRVERLAAAATVAKHWPDKGSRQDAALHLAGCLLRAGWPEAKATQFIRSVATAAGDEEADKRASTVASTATKLEKNSPVTGIRSLAECLKNGGAVVKALKKWLRLKSRPAAGTSRMEGPGFQPTDFGNAERMVSVHGEDLKYVRAWNMWLSWDGRRWATDSTGEIYRKAKTTIRSIYGEAGHVDDDDHRKRLVAHALKSESAPRIEGMISLAQSEAGVAIRNDDLDLDRRKLVVLNGTIDLRSGVLGPHERADLNTKLVSIEFDPKAGYPTWQRFLEDIFDQNQNLISFVKRAAGYTLTGDVSEQVLFFLHGRGANGKTTFLNILLALLGEYGIQGAPDLLLATRGEKHPTDQTDLFRCRLAVCNEVEAGRAFSEVTVKQLTGGDRIRARRMREDYWEFSPTHKIWLAANHKPKVKGTDHAIWRRILLVPFDVIFKGNAVDKQLPDKLMAELPGILRWAVEGCLEWQRQGLAPPNEVQEEVEAYRTEMDLVGRFLDEECTFDSAARIGATPLYEAFVHWAEGQGEHPVTQTVFGERLSARAVTRGKDPKTRRVVWRGVRLGTSGGAK